MIEKNQKIKELESHLHNTTIKDTIDDVSEYGDEDDEESSVYADSSAKFKIHL